MAGSSRHANDSLRLSAHHVNHAHAATLETEQPMTVTNTPTLFERLGGSVSIDVAVDQFYERLLDDTELAPFFEGVPMGRQRAHQKAFLTMALGGRAAYEGRGLHEAHAALTIYDYHVDLVAGHLTGVLIGLGVAPELVAEVIAAVDGLRPTVLGRRD
jgi:hemoglobin